MKSNFDSSVELNNVLEGEETGQNNSKETGQSKESSANEGSREAEHSSPRSSPSHSHQIAFSSELPFSKTREVW